jgi:hypothetical protein
MQHRSAFATVAVTAKSQEVCSVRIHLQMRAKGRELALVDLRSTAICRL